MKEKFSISYFFANEEIRNLIFEEWEKINTLLNNGPEILKEYFYKKWNEIKFELEFTDDIDIIDLDKNIEPNDFDISYSILNNRMKVFNFIMPKIRKEANQVLCCSLLITGKIPRYFILEKKELEEYIVGEWRMDFINNNYIYNELSKLNEYNIGNYLGEISKMVSIQNI